MANATGEANEALRVAFDHRLKLEFHGARIVRHGSYLVLQLREAAVSCALFAAILRRIDHLRGPPVAVA